jgi:mannose-1-phosphate guanylyltransferase
VEILLRWLRRNGVEESYITLGYLGDLIRAVCGDGSKCGMSVTYVQEAEPLNTVGALHLVGRERLSKTFFSVNGDILTNLNLRSLMRFHTNHGGPLTVAVAKKLVPVDLGVMELDGTRVTAFREKPTLSYTVSMGIYCMEPSILDYIPQKVAYGFDDLMYLLLDQHVPVHTYIHDGLWMDLGRPEDYKTAQEVFEKNQSSILGV